MTVGLQYIKTILFVVFLTFVNCDDTGKLLMANVVYRHGARSPIYIYKTDPYRKHWPDGTARLTQIGMNMEYELGKFLEKKYVETKFVSKFYLHEEVTIRSSGVDRCLQSAESQLAGLYPPTEWQVWNKDIAWQPIPVQTVPTNQDPLLRPENTDCPVYDDLIAKMKADSAEYKETVENSTDLLAYMRVHSGEPKLDINSQWTINDCVKAETTENLTQPPWIIARLKEIQDLSLYLFQFNYIGQEGTADLLGRLTGGTLLGKMIENMKSYVGEKPAHKLNLFSGHDTSILSLSAALGIKIEEELPFSAMAIVELYKDSSEKYYVTINYRHGTEVTPWKLADCDYKCPLDEFVLKTKNRVPTDRQAECHAKKHQQDPKQTPVILSYKGLFIASVVMFSLVVILLFALVFRCVRDNMKMKNNAMLVMTSHDEKEALMS